MQQQQKKLERLLTKPEVGSLNRVIKDKLLGKLRGKDNKRKWHYESILYQKNLDTKLINSC